MSHQFLNKTVSKNTSLRTKGLTENDLIISLKADHGQIYVYILAILYSYFKEELLHFILNFQERF